MDIDVARHVVRATFASCHQVGDLLPLLKEHCPADAYWPDGLKGMRGYGVDAMQALILALNMIGIHLYTSGYHEDGVLVWDASGQGYGFPVPSGMRDMLVGDDAKYF